MTDNKGFTLIELILVIAILGILAVSAMPSIFSLTDEAHTAAASGVSANVLAGITLYGAQKMAQTGSESYPASLDSVTAGSLCSIATPCFTDVTKDGVTRDWGKSVVANRYIHLATGDDYEYDSVNGTFINLGPPAGP